MSAFVNPAFFIPYAFILLTFLLSEYLVFSRLPILYLAILLLFNFAVLSYWFFPFFVSINENFVSASNERLNEFNDDFLLKLNSVKIIDAFRADGFWAVQAGEKGESYYQWHDLFLDPLYIILSFFLVSLALTPLLLKSKKKKLFLLWLVFFILAILLNNAYKEDASLLTKINQFIFGNDYVARIFRNVYAKIGILLIIPLSFMTASLIDTLSKHKTRIFILMAIPIILYIAVLALPFIDGTIIRSHGFYLPGDKFAIPQDYYSFQNYDSYQKENSRYFEFPLPRTYNYRFVWNETNKYSGGGILRSFAGSPVIFVNSNYVISTVPCISNKLVLYRLFSLLNVKKVFFHTDIDNRIPDNYVCFSNLDSINESLSDSKLQSYKDFDVYSIPSDYILPKIYTPTVAIMPSNQFEALQDILASSDYTLRSAVYLNVSKASKVYPILASSPYLYTTVQSSQSDIPIPNYSFEEGLWTPTPGDCSDDKPGHPIFNMNLSNDASDGSHSLELSSSNHYACTFIRFPINLSKGNRYKYSFDFKSLAGNKMHYGVIFFSAGGAYSYGNIMDVKPGNWTHYETILTANEDIERIQLSFYAPSENNNLVAILYDNVRMSSINLTLNKSSDNAGRAPVIEFKMISPSKYRIRIHNASNNFPIVFSESYHEGWKIYPNDLWQDKMDLSLLSGYKISEGNQVEQASAAGVRQFIQGGAVSAIGSGSEKTREHDLMESNFENVKYFEKYSIDFISKNVQGSIQNDNLPDGTFYETWLGAPLAEESHIVANGYANSWVIEPKKICSEANKCKLNPDGSYDFELVVEFWPERLFQVGLIISISSLLVCLAFSVYEWRYGKGDRWARKIHDEAMKCRVIRIITR